MSIVVNYWDSSAQKSSVQYWTSNFAMYFSAEDLNVWFDDALFFFYLNKIIQLLMDNMQEKLPDVL